MTTIRLRFSEQEAIGPIPSTMYKGTYSLTPTELSIPTSVVLSATAASLLLDEPVEKPVKVESNMLSSGMEQISEVHKQLLRLNPSVQIANGSTITYPASDSYMVTLFGEQDSLSFHLLHKGLDTTGMVYVGEVDEYWSVAAWRVYRKPQGVCMQLQTTFTFPEELQNMRCAGAVRALRVLRDAIIEQRTYTVSESRTALDSSGNTVQLEPGTSVRFATDYSNTACAGCHVPFPAGMMPKRCTACVLNALYCSKACQRLHWKEHKESCKPEAMLFMRIYEMRMIGNGGGLRIYL